MFDDVDMQSKCLLYQTYIQLAQGDPAGAAHSIELLRGSQWPWQNDVLPSVLRGLIAFRLGTPHSPGHVFDAVRRWCDSEESWRWFDVLQHFIFAEYCFEFLSHQANCKNAGERSHTTSSTVAGASASDDRPSARGTGTSEDANAIASASADKLKMHMHAQPTAISPEVTNTYTAATHSAARAVVFKPDGSFGFASPRKAAEYGHVEVILSLRIVLSRKLTYSLFLFNFSTKSRTRLLNWC